MLDAALAWAARGFRVFPISPGAKEPPRGMAWKAEATTDPAKIRAWWSFEPRYNVGVAAGHGVVVVDVDAGKNGFASLLDLDLPDTLTVKTPGGGWHLYLNGPDVSNSVNRIAPGIDIRSAGGYVVGPGSFFADPGGRKGYTGHYEVLDDRPVATAPPGFILRCGEPKQRDTGTPISVDDPDDIAFAIHYLLKDAPVAIEGRGGNATTYAVAARLIEIGVSVALAVDLLAEHWNERCEPPWSRDELLTIATNAGTYAQSRQGSGGVSALAQEGGDPNDVLTDTAWKPAEPVSSAGKFDKVFEPRPLTPIDQIPKRQWVAHRLLLRNEVALLSGPGGAGKSGWSLALAAHGAVGQPFAGYDIQKPFKTLVYNLEDDRHEMEARLYATCATYGFDVADVERMILLWPGREMRFRLMTKGAVRAAADIQEVARLLKRGGFDAFILDPVLSLHQDDENDNAAMGELTDTMNYLARLSGTAGLGLHHVAKGVRLAGSADAARGAGNLVNSIRIAHTLYAADEDDAMAYGLGDGYKARYFRVDDAKMNAAEKSTKPVWFEKLSYPLPNGDTVQAVRQIDATVKTKGEAKLIATILSDYMIRSGIQHLDTHSAAKALTEAETMFRELVPASGHLGTVRAKIEARLAEPVETDRGVTAVVESKTLPGQTRAVRYVTLA